MAVLLGVVTRIVADQDFKAAVLHPPGTPMALTPNDSTSLPRSDVSQV